MVTSWRAFTWEARLLWCLWSLCISKMYTKIWLIKPERLRPKENIKVCVVVSDPDKLLFYPLSYLENILRLSSTKGKWGGDFSLRRRKAEGTLGGEEEGHHREQGRVRLLWVAGGGESLADRYLGSRSAVALEKSSSHQVAGWPPREDGFRLVFPAGVICLPRSYRNPRWLQVYGSNWRFLGTAQRVGNRTP